MQDCVFCKIAKGDVPCRKLYEDGEILAFHDIRPLTPVHFILIPKKHVANLYELTEEHQEVMGKVLVLAPRLARQQGLEEGFRIIINTGRIARQEVQHVHVHVLGGNEVLPGMLYRSKSD
jgi:histidine triad (HIT) family protein